MEKTLAELKADLEMEENEGLSPTSAHKKQMISATLRQVNNQNRGTSAPNRGANLQAQEL